MENSVRKVTFSPAIKSYILWLVVLFLCISIIGIPLAVLWLMGIGQMISRRYYAALECELTESKLKFKKGVLINVEKTIPLENIQDLTFIEGPILRAFRLSVLKIETAGNSGSGGADMRLIGIEGALEFRNEVLDQRDRLKSSQNSSRGSDSSEEVLNDIREAVKEIRDLLKSKP